MASERILIVDDEPHIVDLCIQILVDLGYDVQGVTRGMDAQTLLESESFDLLLADIQMPDLDGLTVLRRGRELDPNLTAVFITGYATVRYAVDAMQAGAFNYLSKPFELDELLIVIDFAVKNAQLEGKLRIQDYKQRREQQDNKLVGTSEVMNRLRSFARSWYHARLRPFTSVSA